MAKVKRSSFRLDDEHLAMVDEVASHQGGLTKTRVVEWAIERLHAETIPEKSKAATKKGGGKKLNGSADA